MFIKLLSMKKLTLSVMMKSNVKNPVVVGLVVQGSLEWTSSLRRFISPSRLAKSLSL